MDLYKLSVFCSYGESLPYRNSLLDILNKWITHQSWIRRYTPFAIVLYDAPFFSLPVCLFPISGLDCSHPMTRSTVCTVTSLFYPSRPDLYDIALPYARAAAARAFSVEGDGCEARDEVVFALKLLSRWTRATAGSQWSLVWLLRSKPLAFTSRSQDCTARINSNMHTKGREWEDRRKMALWIPRRDCYHSKGSTNLFVMQQTVYTDIALLLSFWTPFLFFLDTCLFLSYITIYAIISRRTTSTGWRIVGGVICTNTLYP